MINFLVLSRVCPYKTLAFSSWTFLSTVDSSTLHMVWTVLSARCGCTRFVTCGLANRRRRSHVPWCKYVLFYLARTSNNDWIYLDVTSDEIKWNPDVIHKRKRTSTYISNWITRHVVPWSRAPLSGASYGERLSATMRCRLVWSVTAVLFATSIGESGKQVDTDICIPSNIASKIRVTLTPVACMQNNCAACPWVPCNDRRTFLLLRGGACSNARS